ncbi:MAG: hypothetical protein ACOX8S_09980 [Christensenellales bacterium]|jgi:hypothetical protein
MWISAWPALRRISLADNTCMPASEARGFKRLFAGCFRDNIASRKTIEKLGAIPITLRDVPGGEVLQYLREENIDMYVWNIAPPKKRFLSRLSNAIAIKERAI